MTRNPCQECESRTATCHAWCPAWLRHEEMRNARYMAQDAQREKEWDVIEFEKHRLWRIGR